MSPKGRLNLSPGRIPISANLRGVFSKRPQNRHPERSASQILSGDTAFRVRSRRTPGLLIVPTLFVPFPPPKPAPGGPPGHSLPCCVISNLCIRLKEHKKPEGESCSRARVSENSKQHRQDKHRRGPSTSRSKRCTTDKFVRRFAQDDDFVGVLKKELIG